jgi:hypothetical protein
MPAIQLSWLKAKGGCQGFSVRTTIRRDFDAIEITTHL